MAAARPGRQPFHPQTDIGNEALARYRMCAVASRARPRSDQGRSTGTSRRYRSVDTSARYRPVDSMNRYRQRLRTAVAYITPTDNAPRETPGSTPCASPSRRKRGNAGETRSRSAGRMRNANAAHQKKQTANQPNRTNDNTPTRTTEDTNKQDAAPQPQATANTTKNENLTHEKKTTRVLHPASRLTPENGGIPPFIGVILINTKVLSRYR